jgi:hypothetical protein
VRFVPGGVVDANRLGVIRQLEVMMNRLILVATLLTVGAGALADDAPVPEKQPKSTKHEEKYLNLVDATKAFKMAKETNKRILVYQDWPS